MSQSQLEMVRETFERFVGAGEIAWETMDPEVEVFDHDLPDAGTYRGYSGFGRWLENWGSVWTDWSLVPKEYIDGGDTVIVVADMTATGTASGVTIEREDALVYRFREGRIIQIDYFNNRHEALESAGVAG